MTETATGTIRVLLTDDHAVLRTGLKMVLQAKDDIDVVGEASTGTEAIEKVTELRPDVVVMDIDMPEMNGLEATVHVKHASPDTKVLFFTSHTEEEKLVPALRAGASGYLPKSVDPEQVAEAIRTVHRGEPLLRAEAAAKLIADLQQSAPQPEGTVTILFTDIESSTEIVDELGDHDARELFREHDKLLRQALRAHGGKEVKHQGDGLMIAFSSARAAIRCACQIQRSMDELNARGTKRAIRVRIGLHTGEAIVEDDDYHGQTVIIAARIEAFAQGGQVLISDLTKTLVGRTDEFGFRDLGEHRLKGLSGSYLVHEVICRAEN